MHPKDISMEQEKRMSKLICHCDALIELSEVPSTNAYVLIQEKGFWISKTVLFCCMSNRYRVRISRRLFVLICLALKMNISWRFIYVTPVAVFGSLKYLDRVKQRFCISLKKGRFLIWETKPRSSLLSFFPPRFVT